MYMHSQAEMHNYYFYNLFKALTDMKFPKTSWGHICKNLQFNYPLPELLYTETSHPFRKGDLMQSFPMSSTCKKKKRYHKFVFKYLLNNVASNMACFQA